MILPPFSYHAPQTLQEVLELLKEEKTYPLAGGTDLLPLMKEGKLHPRNLVSLRKLKELAHLSWEKRYIIGSMVRVETLKQSPLSQAFPALRDACRGMATPQIRHRATVGGNLCTAAACADLPPVFLLADAQVSLVDKDGEKTLPLKDFFLDARKTVLKRNQLLKEITLPSLPPASSYIKFGYRSAANIAIVGVGAAIKLEGETLEKLTVTVTSASPTPIIVDEAMLKVKGESWGSKLIDHVAHKVMERAKPITDLRGSQSYRYHLVEVGVKRALNLARRRHP